MMLRMRWPEDCSRKAEWSSQAGESVWICWCRWSNLPGHVGRLCPLQTCLRVWKWWFDLLETAILIRKIPMNHQIWKLFSDNVKSHGGKATHRFPQRKSIPMTPVDPSWSSAGFADWFVQRRDREEDWGARVLLDKPWINPRLIMFSS